MQIIRRDKFDLVDNMIIKMGEEADGLSCEMFGITGILVQVLLGVLSFSVLVIKREREMPKRPWKIWAMDTSKQAASQFLAHFMNIGISLLMSQQHDSDACYWYFITNMLDNTVGVFLCLALLRFLDHHFITTKHEQYRSGNYYKTYEYYDDHLSATYGSNLVELESSNMVRMRRKIIVNYRAWMVQFVIWNFVVMLCKSCLLMLEMLLDSPLHFISSLALGWVQDYPAAELILVMIVIPLFMNALAFWVQDNFLQKKVHLTPNAKEPLI